MTVKLVSPVQHNIITNELFIIRESMGEKRLRLIAKTDEYEYTDLCYLSESASSHGIPHKFNKPFEIDCEIKCLGPLLTVMDNVEK